ncbi:MAG: hypothetical protein F6K63_02300 [Moorea sp. SIO1G6]|nr:hypothetical protein [Moorena sp. SIO1G6]
MRGNRERGTGNREQRYLINSWLLPFLNYSMFTTQIKHMRYANSGQRSAVSGQWSAVCLWMFA